MHMHLTPFSQSAAYIIKYLSHFQDVTDLFGADLPVEGAEGGRFAWRDGPLLQALKAGSWVVLDEVRYEEILFFLCYI
ncbi:hypothetical protein DPMN_054921 [Dreissena polymorpha]|uniref:Midasin n=1 Tax=Dreissena polymorpha TaxID=45954 RepID=A0A9D4CP06_DREPO|nr:hypothetical protein DPMN_054921 [Dreissena polymorpha]